MLNRRPVRFFFPRPVIVVGAALAALASTPVLAQNSQESFVPPMGNWSLPPSGQPAPTPTPAPQQTPVPQPPVVMPTITPTPTPRAQPRAPTPQADPTATPAQQEAAPIPEPTPQPQDDAPADTAPTPLPNVTPMIPQPATEASPVPGAIGAPPGGLPRWLVVILAGALAGGAGWFLFRRRRDAAVEDQAEADAESSPPQPMPALQPERADPLPATSAVATVPVWRVAGEVATPAVRRPLPVAAVPGPPPPAPPPARNADLPRGMITPRIPPLGRGSPPSPATPLPTPRPRANGGGLGFVLNAQRITVSMTQLMLEFELIAENHTDVAVATLDVATAMMTAHVDQDAQIARFFSERPDSPATALDVEAQMTRGLNGKLSMPLAQVNPVETGGRSYCVPIMMIDARYVWADGREERKSVAFVMGKGAQDANKLGPIFLDRGPAVTREVGARLHTPLRRAS